MEIEALVEILHTENCSCVISNAGNISRYHQKGVKDLFTLLKSEPEKLDGAMIADKVIGKGAAALMILGKVKRVHADVISQPALSLFDKARIEFSYGKCVPNIINRTKTGICPVETLCIKCKTPEECLPLITQFINENKK